MENNQGDRSGHKGCARYDALEMFSFLKKIIDPTFIPLFSFFDNSRLYIILILSLCSFAVDWVFIYILYKPYLIRRQCGQPWRGASWCWRASRRWRGTSCPSSTTSSRTGRCTSRTADCSFRQQGSDSLRPIIISYCLIDKSMPLPYQ